MRRGVGVRGFFRGLTLFIGLGAVALAAPFAVYPVFLMHGLVMALFATSFNMLFGYAGLLSFGHAAFFGTAAYVASVLLKEYGLTTEIALAGAVSVSMFLGLVMGVLSIRRRGIYFAMVTLALAEVVHFLAQRIPGTGGENGYQGVPRGLLFGVVDLNSTLHLYFFVLLAVTVGLLIAYRALQSPFGMVLRGFRDNEQRVVSLGYRVNVHLLLAMVLSAGLAGLAGALKALIFQLAALSDLSWHSSGLVVLACLIGGVGTFAGPIIGGMALALIFSVLAEAGEWATLITGLIFIACVLLFRQGLMGSLPKLASALRQHRGTDNATLIPPARVRHDR